MRCIIMYNKSGRKRWEWELRLLWNVNAVFLVLPLSVVNLGQSQNWYDTEGKKISRHSQNHFSVNVKTMLPLIVVSILLCCWVYIYVVPLLCWLGSSFVLINDRFKTASVVQTILYSVIVNTSHTPTRVTVPYSWYTQMGWVTLTLTLSTLSTLG